MARNILYILTLFAQETLSEGGRDTGDGASVTEGGSVYSAPPSTTTLPGGGSTPDDATGSHDSDPDQFEASLHMGPVGRSNSGARDVQRSPRRGSASRLSNGAATPRSERSALNARCTNGAATPREMRDQLSRAAYDTPGTTTPKHERSPHDRTVKIQVPASHRTHSENEPSNKSNNYRNGFPRQGNHFNPGEARRIQPEGESEHEPCDSDFRQRCHSDSSSRANTGGGQRGSLSAQGSLSSRDQSQSSRPLSCYTALDGGGSKITGLPPKGLPMNPRLYPQRLERTVLPNLYPPADSNVHQSQGAPPTNYLKQALPPNAQQSQQHPSAAMDSLRSVMMRRWDSDQLGFRGDNVSDSHPSTPVSGGSLGLHRKSGNSVSVHLACWVSADAQQWELQTQTCI